MLEDCSYKRLILLRVYIAYIASYMFFNRGECTSTALVEDLVADDSPITLRLRNNKEQKALNKGQRMVR
jgi:hypothetical protein